MNFGAHICFGATAGTCFLLLVGKYGFSPEPISFMAGCTIGSFFPDIDHPKSFIGRKVPLLPKLLYKTVGHRTLTHSILFTIVFSSFLYRANKSAGIGFFIGMSSHILLDIITPFSKGVSIFYPISKSKVGILKR